MKKCTKRGIFFSFFSARSMAHPLSAMFAEEKLMEARQEHIFR
jgi:hypothetical protein